MARVEKRKNPDKIQKAKGMVDPWYIDADENDPQDKYIFDGIKNTNFISSDPKVLINKLNILLAEKQAGNNNVFNEISAISDELRRNGILSLKQLKSLYKKIR